jgi:dihydrofolate reductase
MRKLKLQIQVSIDGFIAGSKGEMDWMTWDWSNDLKNYVQQLTDSVDTIILGRKLAEGFIPHWAVIAADHDNLENETGKFFNDTPKIVFTKTLKKSDWKNSILADDLIEKTTELKKQSGKDIIAYGGADFVSNLIKEGLIDEFHLFINPAAIGRGMAIFNKVNEKQNFKLMHSESFECGITVLVYTLVK